jgi:hypothetical protein
MSFAKQSLYHALRESYGGDSVKKPEDLSVTYLPLGELTAYATPSETRARYVALGLHRRLHDLAW